MNESGTGIRLGTSGGWASGFVVGMGNGFWVGLLLLVGMGVGGCAGRGPTGNRAMTFPGDTLSITNETVWSYGVDPMTGEQVHVPRDPPPTYSLRCFVLVRVVKQFHAHAEFDAGSAPWDEAGNRRLIRKVVGRSPRGVSPEGKRVRIPGYGNLAEFSRAWPRLFQEESGWAWRSYLQRGHWRMIFPFTGRGQEREAEALVEGLKDHRAPAVHVVDFPGLRVNHALLLVGMEEDADRIRFAAYDPNTPGKPVTLRFDRATRRFNMDSTPYFVGGPVSVYEVYCRGLR